MHEWEKKSEQLVAEKREEFNFVRTRRMLDMKILVDLKTKVIFTVHVNRETGINDCWVVGSVQRVGGGGGERQGTEGEAAGRDHRCYQGNDFHFMTNAARWHLSCSHVFALC